MGWKKTIEGKEKPIRQPPKRGAVERDTSRARGESGGGKKTKDGGGGEGWGIGRKWGEKRGKLTVKLRS